MLSELQLYTVCNASYVVVAMTSNNAPKRQWQLCVLRQTNFLIFLYGLLYKNNSSMSEIGELIYVC